MTAEALLLFNSPLWPLNHTGLPTTWSEEHHIIKTRWCFSLWFFMHGRGEVAVRWINDVDILFFLLMTTDQVSTSPLSLITSMCSLSWSLSLSLTITHMHNINNTNKHSLSPPPSLSLSLCISPSPSSFRPAAIRCPDGAVLLKVTPV